MKIKKTIKERFLKYKKKKLILSELNKITKYNKNSLTKHRKKEISESLYRAFIISNKFRNQKKSLNKKCKDEKLIMDLKLLIEKHFSDENKYLKKQNFILNKKISELRHGNNEFKNEKIKIFNPNTSK